MIAIRLWIVLLNTTGLYCSHSSLEYPVSWIIFICFTIVLFPDSPAPNFNKIEMKYYKITINIIYILNYITLTISIKRCCI